MSAMKHVVFALAAIVGMVIHPAVGLIALVVWIVVAIALRSKPKDAMSAEGVVPAMQADEGLRPLPLSSRGRLGAVGEYYYQPSIRKLVGRQRIGSAGDWDRGLQIDVYLEPEPSNRHDSNAVALYGDRGNGRHLVGYLPRDVARTWQPRVVALRQQGAEPVCRGMVYRQDDGKLMVVLQVAAFEDAFPGNVPPAGSVRLDAQRRASLVRESVYQDTLTKLPMGLMWATLTAGIVEAGKYKGSPTIDVHIDGSKAGQLSAAQGARYADVLNEGLVVACEATVYAGPKYREVAIHLPRVD